MRYTVIIYVMLLPALLFTCKRKAPDPEVTKNYVADLHIRYLEAERTLKATASFFERQDEEKLKAWQPKEKVLFQASSMNERNIQQNTFRYLTESFDLSFMPPYQFSFVDGQGKSQQVKLNMEAFGAFSLEGVCSKQEGIKIKIERGQLEKQESLVFLFSDAENKAYSHSISGPYDENTFFLPPQVISAWPVGEGQLYIVKKQVKTIIIDNWTFLTQLELYGNTSKIEILE